MRGVSDHPARAPRAGTRAVISLMTIAIFGVFVSGISALAGKIDHPLVLGAGVLAQGHAECGAVAAHDVAHLGPESCCVLVLV